MRMRAVATLLVLLPAVVGASGLPHVERLAGTASGIVPGAGRALISGRMGEEILDHGPIQRVVPSQVSEEAAVWAARAFSGLHGTSAWTRRWAFAEEAGPHGETKRVLRFGHTVDLVGSSSLQAIRVYVDGHGRALGLVPLHKDASANVFERSPSHGAPIEVLLHGLVSEELLDGEGFLVRGCGPGEGPGCEIHSFAVPDQAGDWLYRPHPSDPHDPFAEVNAFHHLADAREILAAAGLDEYPRDLQAIVNFRFDLDGDGSLDPYPNAAYVPGLFPGADGLIFGHTGEGSMSHDADVLRHELVHAATVHLAELNSRFDEYGYDHQPSMIAEAVADYFAAAISGDPSIGAHVGMLLGLGEGGVRRLDLDLFCPRDMVGLVHDDSLVLSGALWRAREVVGSQMDEVVAAALRAMPYHPSIAQAVLAILAVSSVHLGAFDRERVEEILDEFGLLTCSRFLPLVEEEVAVGHLPVTGQMVGMSPGPFQYRFLVPRGVSEVRIRLEPVDPENEGRGIIHARLAAPVRYLTRVMGDRVWFEIEHDLVDQEEIVFTSDWWPLDDTPAIFISPANATGRVFPYRLAVGTKSRPYSAHSRDEIQAPPSSTIATKPKEDDPPGCPGFFFTILAAALLLGRLPRRRTT